MVRRFGRLRFYEIVLLLDFVAVVVLLRVRARLGIDVVRTVLDMKGFVLFAAAILAGGLLLRALVAARRGKRRGLARLRASFRPRALVDHGRLLLALALTSYVYGWLKVALPLLRWDVLYDEELFRLETALHVGVNPGRLLQGLFPYPAIWSALDVYYGAFMWTVFIGIGWFAAALGRRERALFAGGFSLLWVLGSWFYLATPSLGPCYVLKDDYTEVRAAMPHQSATMDLLFAHYGRVRGIHKHPEGVELSTFYGVAAMPSLHVAAQAFLALFARRRSRVLFLAFTAATLLTLFTSVVSGWHYAIDGYAALLLAVAALALGNATAPRPGRA